MPLVGEGGSDYIRKRVLHRILEEEGAACQEHDLVH